MLKKIIISSIALLVIGGGITWYIINKRKNDPNALIDENQKKLIPILAQKQGISVDSMDDYINKKNQMTKKDFAYSTLNILDKDTLKGKDLTKDFILYKTLLSKYGYNVNSVEELKKDINEVLMKALQGIFKPIVSSIK